MMDAESYSSNFSFQSELPLRGGEVRYNIMNNIIKVAERSETVISEEKYFFSKVQGHFLSLYIYLRLRRKEKKIKNI